MKKQKLFFGNSRKIDGDVSFWVNGSLKKLPNRKVFRRDLLNLIKHRADWRVQLDKILTFRDNIGNIEVVPDDCISWASAFQPSMVRNDGPSIGALFQYDSGEKK